MQKEIRILRIRFVSIVIMIVTIVMACIFGCISHFTRKALIASSYNMLETIAKSPMQYGSIEPLGEDIKLPYFVLDVDEHFAIITSYGGYYDLSDRESINAALNYAVRCEDSRGHIPSYELRFLKYDCGNGMCTIAFADVSSQVAIMNRLRAVSTVICVTGIATFALIAMFLSKWVVMPVERSWNQQKQFVSDASHELKTPLTVITTNAELLQTEDCGEQDREKYTGNILTVSHQMRSLIEDMLNLARVEKGESAVFTRLDMSQTMSDALLQFEPVMFELGLDLIEDIKSGIFVKGSAQRLSQLLTILLDNAGKYAKPGNVKVSLEAIGKCAVLTVANVAEPLSEQQLKDIFKRFYSVDEAHSAKGSYGLGLAIARSICEAHGGKIHAEYQNGEISFIASIPFA